MAEKTLTSPLSSFSSISSGLKVELPDVSSLSNLLLFFSLKNIKSNEGFRNDLRIHNWEGGVFCNYFLGKQNPKLIVLGVLFDTGSIPSIVKDLQEFYL